MAKRKHTTEEIINKLREAEVLIAAGRTVVEAPGASVSLNRPSTAGGPSTAVSESIRPSASSSWKRRTAG